MPPLTLFLRTIVLPMAFGLLVACSSAKKKTPELGAMGGKKVALIEILGESTARATVEVALINQILKRGTFDLISKQDVEKARLAPDQDSTDWVGVARRAGADYAMRVDVQEFDAPTREGYSSVEVEDSQLAEERGEEGRKTQRLYKVKAIQGKVKLAVEFVDARNPKAEGAVRKGTAEVTKEVVAEAKDRAALLPPKLRFLEGLSQQAFEEFFEKYQ